MIDKFFNWLESTNEQNVRIVLGLLASLIVAIVLTVLGDIQSPTEFLLVFAINMIAFSFFMRLVDLIFS